MLALMEKHKSQYDQMVHEKDAELDAHKRKEMEAAALMKSLENMQKELTDLKKVLSSTKCTQPPEARNKQSPDYKQRGSKTPKDSSSTGNMFDSSEAKRTPSYSQTALKKKAVSLFYQKFLGRLKKKSLIIKFPEFIVHSCIIFTDSFFYHFHVQDRLSKDTEGVVYV
ncbi:Synaptonemal complex protein 1 [Liparis tanakae]|uniref:Synaptonemal complex protein 1 n=1 Tax=Liparis tanakae TaxID=230148 RepID=A0A4Z2IFA0_9TELE|nr:Synaptonemal complex protein 1 [Liparis tanakae]